MSQFTLGKRCDICGVEIPDNYGNLLCDACYEKVTKQNEVEKKLREESIQSEISKNPSAPTNANMKDGIDTYQQVLEPMEQKEYKSLDVSEVKEDLRGTVLCKHETCGIQDPNYRENPEMDDKDQVYANLAQFVYSNKLLWYPTRNMYNYIRNYAMGKVKAHPQFPKQIWKPYVVDVGCGCGVGSNILSEEAHFVWGIDKNERSIKFAKEAFTRNKNQIYYTSELKFDVFDIMVDHAKLAKDSRQVMQFDFVVAIEIIEHVNDSEGFIKSLHRFTRRNKKGDVHISNPTEFFISTPNRNSPKIKKDFPENPFHVREYTAKEFRTLLEKYFESVQLMDQSGNTVEDNTEVSPILAKCFHPKI